MILHEMIIRELRKGHVVRPGVHPGFILVHPDRIRKIFAENPYLTLLAQEKEDELQQAALGARKEREGQERERAETIAQQNAEAKKLRLAEIQLENEEKEKALQLQQKEIEAKKAELRASRELAADASGKAAELVSKTSAAPAPKAKKKTAARKTAKKKTK